MNNSIDGKKWMVIYTRPKWEKKIDQVLQQLGIESYCPLRVVNRKWADRMKEVSIPLFSCYIFVHVNLKDYANVLTVAGVLGYVFFMGKPAIVRDGIMNEMKINLSRYKDAEIVDLRSLSVGERVCISKGVFADQAGKVICIQGKSVLLVLENMNCALVARIPVQDIIKQNITNQNDIIPNHA
ncbi:MAG: UpxY family transcription antiterminator [Mucilaginibacter sp.]|jgi:transcription antitermination factor NusG|uniref:UpxY family transcription antiterminator n=1 Tax=Mucilaginibacter sp. TaxID=1882438 RepID=UPI0035658EAD